MVMNPMVGSAKKQFKQTQAEFGSLDETKQKKLLNICILGGLPSWTILDKRIDTPKTLLLPIIPKSSYLALWCFLNLYITDPWSSSPTLWGSVAVRTRSHTSWGLAPKSAKTSPTPRYMGVSKNRGIPKWMVYYWKPYSNGLIWGFSPYFWFNTHMWRERTSAVVPESSSQLTRVSEATRMPGVQRMAPHQRCLTQVAVCGWLVVMLRGCPGIYPP